MAASAQQLAAALGAPAPTAPRFAGRSKYLAQALEALGRDGGKIQSGGELGARLLAVALAQRGKEKADDRMYEALTADRQAQYDAYRKYGEQIFGQGNEAAITAFMMDPEAAMGAYWEGQKPREVTAGNTLIPGFGRPNFVAPKMGIENGFGYSQTMDGGVNWGNQRPQTHSEVETNRHNVVGESQGWRGLDIQQQNANTGQFSAQTGRMAHDARVAAGGYGTPGVGGVLGANLDPNEWEILPGTGAPNAPRR